MNQLEIKLQNMKLKLKDKLKSLKSQTDFMQIIFVQK